MGGSNIDVHIFSRFGSSKERATVRLMTIILHLNNFQQLAATIANQNSRNTKRRRKDAASEIV